MKEGFLLAGLLALANSAVSVAGPEKIVIHTPWWPAGSERTSEAVGILSRGEIFMTGMMESNHTLDLQIEQELLDVRDIAVGGESDMNHVVSCFVNSKYAGSAAAVHQAMAEQTSSFGGAAVTVVESAGEWSVFNNSVTCRAVQASASDKVVLHGEEGTNDVAVVANNLVHISVEGTDINDALNKTSVFLQEATNSTTSTAAIVDCFVGVTQLSEAPTVRAAFNTSAIVPTLTIVQVGLVPGATVALQCVASLNATDVVVSPQLPAPMDEGFATPRAVTAGGFVYVDGVPAADINGTDGLLVLGEVLESAGSSLKEVLMCNTFVRSLSYVKPYFGSFYLFFNVANYPPPARAEFTVPNEWPTAELVLKCIAAVPETRSSH